MSENIEVKAVLTADDRASPVIRSLIRDLERLKKLQTSLSPVRLVDEKETGRVNAAASAVEKLAAANRRLSESARKLTLPSVNVASGPYGAPGAAFLKSMKVGGAEAAKAIQGVSAATQRASRVEESALKNRLAGIRLTSRLMAGQNRQQARAAADNERRSRADLAERLSGLRLQSRLMAAHSSEQSRIASATGRQIRAGWRQFSQAPGRMADRLSGFAGPAIGGALGVATAARLARSGIAGRMDADSAETNARIFGGMTPEQVREARSGWIDRAAVENGIKPSAAINAATESLKAGVDMPSLRGITETILRATTALELDVTETTRLVGRIGTLRHSFDPASTARILNSVAIAARDTAADSNEIIAGMRRGAGALGASKMTPDELSAFVAVGSSVGLAPQKAGTFMDFIVNQLANAKNEHGQRRKDMARASSMARLGGLGNISREAANNPAQFLQMLLDNMADLDEGKRADVAHKLAGREWSGELLQMVQGRETLRSTLKAIADPKNANFLSEAQRLKMASMSGKLGQLKSIGSLAWESVGVGLSDAFDKIVTFFTKLGSPDRFQAISGATKSAVDGLVKGLGFENVTTMLESAFGGSKDRIGAFGESVGQFFRGVGEGVREFWSAAKPILASLGGTDAKSIGKLAAQLTGLSLALSILRPVLSILGVFKDALLAIGGLVTMGLALRGGAGLMGLLGIGALASPIGMTIIAGGALAVAVMNWDKLKAALNGIFRWQVGDGAREMTPEEYDRRKAAGGKSFGDLTTWEIIRQLFRRSSVETVTDGPRFQKASLSVALDDFSRDVRRIGAEIEKANFRSAFGDAKIHLASLSGPSQSHVQRLLDGGRAPLVTTSPTFGLSDERLSRRLTEPGASIPSYVPRGTGRSAVGSSIGPSPATISAAGPGAAVERFANGRAFNEKGAAVMARLQRDFGLTRTQAAAIVGNLGHESKGLQAINEEKPLIPGSRGGFGWAQWTGPRRRAFDAWVAKNGLDPKSDEANYGFLKHELQTTHKHAIKNLKRQSDPHAAMVQFESDYEGAGIKAFPSRWKWTQRALGLPDIKAPDLANAAGTQSLQTTPQALAASIPPVGGFAGSRFNPQAGGGRSSPNVQIHINGHNGDPEALANQVQKRIDENMRWRTHDVELDNI